MVDMRSRLNASSTRSMSVEVARSSSSSVLCFYTPISTYSRRNPLSRISSQLGQPTRSFPLKPRIHGSLKILARRQEDFVFDREDLKRKSAENREYLATLLNKQNVVGMSGAAIVASGIQALQSALNLSSQSTKEKESSPLGREEIEKKSAEHREYFSNLLNKQNVVGLSGAAIFSSGIQTLQSILKPGSQMEKEKRIVSDREEIERKRAQDQEYLRNLLSKQYAVGLFGAVAVVSSIQAIQSVLNPEAQSKIQKKIKYEAMPKKEEVSTVALVEEEEIIEEKTPAVAFQTAVVDKEPENSTKESASETTFESPQEPAEESPIVSQTVFRPTQETTEQESDHSESPSYQPTGENGSSEYRAVVEPRNEVAELTNYIAVLHKVPEEKPSEKAAEPEESSSTETKSPFEMRERLTKQQTTVPEAFLDKEVEDKEEPSFESLSESSSKILSFQEKNEEESVNETKTDNDSYFWSTPTTQSSQLVENEESTNDFGNDISKDADQEEDGRFALGALYSTVSNEDIGGSDLEEVEETLEVEVEETPEVEDTSEIEIEETPKIEADDTTVETQSYAEEWMQTTSKSYADEWMPKTSDSTSQSYSEEWMPKTSGSQSNPEEFPKSTQSYSDEWTPKTTNTQSYAEEWLPKSSSSYAEEWLPKTSSTQSYAQEWLPKSSSSYAEEWMPKSSPSPQIQETKSNVIELQTKDEPKSFVEEVLEDPMPEIEESSPETLVSESVESNGISMEWTENGTNVIPEEAVVEELKTKESEFSSEKETAEEPQMEVVKPVLEEETESEVTEPMFEEPAAEKTEPMLEEALSEESQMEAVEPVLEEPVAGEPETEIVDAVLEEAVTEEPQMGAAEPVLEEDVTGEPETEIVDAVFEEAVTEEPQIEAVEPVLEEAIFEESQMGAVESLFEMAVAQEPEVEITEPVLEEAVSEESQIEAVEPVLEEGVTGEPETEIVNAVLEETVPEEPEMEVPEPMLEEAVPEESQIEAVEPVLEEAISEESQMGAAEPLFEMAVAQEPEVEITEPVLEEAVSEALKMEFAAESVTEETTDQGQEGPAYAVEDLTTPEQETSVFDYTSQESVSHEEEFKYIPEENVIPDQETLTSNFVSNETSSQEQKIEELDSIVENATSYEQDTAEIEYTEQELDVQSKETAEYESVPEEPLAQEQEVHSYEPVLEESASEVDETSVFNTSEEAAEQKQEPSFFDNVSEEISAQEQVYKELEQIPEENTVPEAETAEIESVLEEPIVQEQKLEEVDIVSEDKSLNGFIQESVPEVEPTQYSVDSITEEKNEDKEDDVIKETASETQPLFATSEKQTTNIRPQTSERQRPNPFRRVPFGTVPVVKRVERIVSEQQQNYDQEVNPNFEPELLAYVADIKKEEKNEGNFLTGVLNKKTFLLSASFIVYFFVFKWFVGAISYREDRSSTIIHNEVAQSEALPQESVYDQYEAVSDEDTMGESEGGYTTEGREETDYGADDEESPMDDDGGDAKI